MNLERVIVIISEKEIPSIYDFLKAGETDEQAEDRGFFDSLKNVKTYIHHSKHYPRIMDDGSEYWQKQLEKEEAREYKAMSFNDFKSLERKYILDQPLKEITEDDYNEMLNVLPPRAWTRICDIEMFCMSEFYTGTYTNQYAKDHRIGKYYTKLVDFCDRSTWINNYL